MKKSVLLLVLEECNFIFFRLKKIETPIPIDLNQFSTWQLSRLADGVLNNNLEEKCSLFHLIYIFYLKEPTIKNFYKLIHLLLRVPDTELQKHAEFLYSHGILTRFIELKGFTGPGTALKDLTYEEYILTERYYSNYLQRMETHDLNCLIAVLYRKAKFTHRTLINSSDVSEGVIHAEKLNFKKKQVVLLSYKGSRDIARKRFTEINNQIKAKEKHQLCYHSQIDFIPFKQKQILQ